MNNISNPHDKFFRETFSRVDVVQSLIQELFPDKIRQKINLQSLELSNASFIDETLSEHLADIVYQAEFADKKVFVTLIFEHKSYIESFPHWQLLRYLTNTYQEQQKQKEDPIMVIPILIYHGETAWKKMPMRSYFKDFDLDLEQFLPDFDYILISLNDLPDAQIESFKNVFLSMAAMLLKHSRDEKMKFLAIENFLIDRIKMLEVNHAEGYIASVMLYLQNSSNLTFDELIVIFTKVSKKSNYIAMTAAENLKEDLTFDYVKGLWERGLNSDLIADAFKIPLDKIEAMIKKIKEENQQ